MTRKVVGFYSDRKKRVRPITVASPHGRKKRLSAKRVEEIERMLEGRDTVIDLQKLRNELVELETRASNVELALKRDRPLEGKAKREYEKLWSILDKTWESLARMEEAKREYDKLWGSANETWRALKEGEKKRGEKNAMQK